MEILDSTRKDKRFMAVFNNGKVIHFGAKFGNTFIDHKDNKKKENYIKRHSKLNENWNDPYTAGTLSRFILWEKPTLNESVKFYINKFNL